MLTIVGIFILAEKISCSASTQEKFYNLGAWLIFIITVYRNSLFNANNVDYDQMLHSGVSDLGLHCLSASLLWDARHEWVKMTDDCKKQTEQTVILTVSWHLFLVAFVLY